MYKQVIVVRKDLKMGKGKLASQVAHASLLAYKNSGLIKRIKWEREGAKKVVLEVGSLEELQYIYRKAKKLKLAVSIVRDAGKTQLRPGTITCICIGPEKEEKIDKITKHLKLL